MFLLSANSMRKMILCFFFFNDTATTEIYTLSLHDALPIYRRNRRASPGCALEKAPRRALQRRSEEHTSELQSHHDLVCRLLLEKTQTIARRRRDHVTPNIHLGEPKSGV